MTGELTGLPALLRLALRRDRIVLPAWVLVLGLLPLFYLTAVRAAYSSPAQLQGYQRSTNSSAGEVALVGHVFGSSLGAVTAWRTGFVLVFLALANVITAVRHTRTEEEAGRRELVAGTAVGRQTPLIAALQLCALADTGLAGLVAVTLVAGGLGVSGSLLLAASMGGFGWLLAAFGALAAQFSASARTSRALAASAIGVGYLLRAVGDAEPRLGWLSWLSPFGWAQRTQPFAGQRWWPLLLLAAGTAVATVAALRLSMRRDLGTGLVRERPGPGAAAPSLASVTALAWRQNRTSVFGWLGGLAIGGVVLGSAATTAGQQLAGAGQGVADAFRRLGGGGSLSDVFLVAVLGVMGTAASAFGVQLVLRLSAEEAVGRAELVLSTAVGRVRWAAGTLGVVFAGSVSAMVATGLGAGFAAGISQHDVGRELPRVLIGALVQLPAIWLLTGVAMLFVGLLPRWPAGAWAVLAAFVLLGQLAEVLRLDRLVLDLSPFAHVPRVPGGSLHADALLWLTVVAVGLTVTGMLALQRRDLH